MYVWLCIYLFSVNNLMVKKIEKVTFWGTERKNKANMNTGK